MKDGTFGIGKQVGGQMTHKKECNHNTENELDFLDKLGRHCERRSEVRRMNALDGYITAARKRVDWGDIDKGRVIAHAQRLLA